MNHDIIFDGFNCPFSDVIDKAKYEAFKIPEVENGWVVRKLEVVKEQEFQEQIKEK